MNGFIAHKFEFICNTPMSNHISIDSMFAQCLIQQAIGGEGYVYIKAMAI